MSENLNTDNTDDHVYSDIQAGINDPSNNDPECAHATINESSADNTTIIHLDTTELEPNNYLIADL